MPNSDKNSIHISEISGPVISATGRIINAYSDIFCKLSLLIKSFFYHLINLMIQSFYFNNKGLRKNDQEFGFKRTDIGLTIEPLLIIIERG